LAWLGFTYGVGLTESATFLVFLPILGALLLREMFRWHALKSWKSHAAFWLCFLSGASLHLFNAVVLYRRGRYMELFDSPWEALFQILHDQLELITQVRFNPAFFVIMFFTLLPWLVVFAMSRRSPWFYEWGQILIRFVFLCGLLGILYNARYAPWHLMGADNLMVTPYLLMAIGVGYMTGEFWILGEQQVLMDRRLYQLVLRGLSSLLALLMPFLVLGSIWKNWSIADGKHGRMVYAAAANILDHAGSRQVIFSSGLLDNHLRLIAWERREPFCIISASRLSSPVYLKSLSGFFLAPELQVPLQRNRFNQFLDTLMLSESGPQMVGIVDLSDLFRGYGYLVPNGLLYHLQPSVDGIDWDALVAQQVPFWSWVNTIRHIHIPDDNPVKPYQDLLCLQASKVANNLGVFLLEEDQPELALASLREAGKMEPRNISVILNLLGISAELDLSEEEDLEKRLEEEIFALGGVRWGLARQFGYVWNAREWILRGLVWALSGEAPELAGAAREEETTTLGHMLDQAFGEWGTTAPTEIFYRNRLMQNERDVDALMALARMALKKNEPDMAEAYISEALTMGAGEENVLFEEAMLAYVRGDRKTALDKVRDITLMTPSDVRAWLALALLTDVGTMENEQAIRTIQLHRTTDIAVRLSLAQLFIDRRDWTRAQAELEQAVQRESQNLAAWEMMGVVANETGNQPLLAASLRALQIRDPNHYLKFQQEGLEHYAAGRLAQAEDSFRKGIQQKRDSRMLNNLAHVIMERDGNLTEALALVNEAIRRSASLEAGMFSTRADIHLKRGQVDRAQKDIEWLIQKQAANVGHLLQYAGFLRSEGKWDEVKRTLETISRDFPTLSDEQQKQWQDLESGMP
jgi:Tfp pilus assembly protein PilF